MKRLLAIGPHPPNVGGMAGFQQLSSRINKSLTSVPEREAKRKPALEALCHAILSNVALSALSGALGGWF